MTSRSSIPKQTPMQNMQINYIAEPRKLTEKLKTRFIMLS